MIQHNHDLEILKQMAMADGILTENEKELFDEDFYCIPKRVFDMCHLDYESIQIIVEQGQMVITNPHFALKDR